MISRLLVRRNFERSAQHCASHLRRKTRHDLFQSGCDRAGVSAKKTFENAYCRIEHGVMLPEKADEVAHVGFVGSKFAGALGNLGKAISIAGLFHFRKQEVEHDKIKMLDFISTAFDELPR